MMAPSRTRAGILFRRAKHFLWHGNTFRAIDILEDLRDDFDTAYRPQADDKQRAFFERLSEFCTYISRNSEEIPNYGERHRCGEPIFTATAEATVNRVISRRMVKKQQMRWSPRGAHLLLQVRTRVLNDDLAGDFARWYPDSPAQPSDSTPLPDRPRPGPSRGSGALSTGALPYLTGVVFDLIAGSGARGVGVSCRYGASVPCQSAMSAW
jgi:hypothetical protein